MRMNQTWLRAAVVLALLLLSTVAAPNLARYTLDLGTTLLILMTAAQAWNLLAGFTGQFSLGVSAFIGTGAYAAALAMIHWGVGAPLAVLIGALGAAVLALVLAPALIRLRGDYFTIGSLGAALAVQAWAVNADLVGRSAGIDVPVDLLPDNVELFRLAVAAAAAAALATIWLAGSSVGLRMLAVGQDQDAAVGMGINVFWLRTWGLVVSSLLTGAAGAVVALQQVHIEPTGTLGITWTINVLLMTVIGGLGTLLGPIIGTALIYLGLTKQLSDQPILGLVIQGIILIVLVRYAPRGLWPTMADLLKHGRSKASRLSTGTSGTDRRTKEPA